MAPPHKGKPPTKGVKQIHSENLETINFYRLMSLAAVVFYNFVSFIMFYESLTGLDFFLNFSMIMIHIGCYQMMTYMSQPRFSDNNKVISSGLDLNMEGGMGEHVKDIIILASITHVLAVVSSFFWMLLLLLPVRAFYLIWKHILGPWFFQAGEPEEPEQSEKKRRKMERKMNRQK